MAHKGYGWKVGQPAPLLEDHSKEKHRLLATYLRSYIKTLAANPAQDSIRFSVVDGFAGGGTYTDPDTNLILPGSPLRAIEAVDSAVAELNLTGGRRKQLRNEVDFHFVEKDADAYAFLCQSLVDRAIPFNVPNARVSVYQGAFETFAPGVIAAIHQRSKRAGKSIFILDQYGYSKVPVTTLRQIFAALPKAEVILTFHVDSLINYLNDENLARAEVRLAVPTLLAGASLSELRQSHASPHLRRVVQAVLWRILQAEVGVPYSTPFFLKPKSGQGMYWLVHFATQLRAHDVMKETHWNGLSVAHYGLPGVDMLGYDARSAKKLREIDSVFGFDESAAGKTHLALTQEIPELVATGGSITFGELVQRQIANTPATQQMIASATFEAAKNGDIRIFSANSGRERRSANGIAADDVLARTVQTHFDFSRT